MDMNEDPTLSTSAEREAAFWSIDSDRTERTLAELSTAAEADETDWAWAVMVAASAESEALAEASDAWADERLLAPCPAEAVALSIERERSPAADVIDARAATMDA